MEKYDLIVVGMGPSAIFLAYELIQKKANKNILLIEEGKRVEDRFCPIEKTGQCIKCKPYNGEIKPEWVEGTHYDIIDGKTYLYNFDPESLNVYTDYFDFAGIVCIGNRG